MRTISHEVWISADARTVFTAITMRDGLDAWWGKAVKAEPARNSVIEFDHGLGEPLRMRVADIEPNERVEWRCVSDFSVPGNPASEWLGHRLRFELVEGGGLDSEWMLERLGLERGADLTRLRFTHAGWARDARWYAFCNHAWGVTLDGLRSYCETGEPPAHS